MLLTGLPLTGLLMYRRDCSFTLLKDYPWGIFNTLFACQVFLSILNAGCREDPASALAWLM